MAVACLLILLVAVWRESAPIPPFLANTTTTQAATTTTATQAATARSQAATLWLVAAALMIIWIFFATSLIDRAVDFNSSFRVQAEKMCSECESKERITGSSLALVWPGALDIVLWVGAGVLVTFLDPTLEKTLYWRISLTLIVASCFYYASFGLWAAFKAATAVKKLAEFISESDLLNPFHPDCMGGLGFAVRYADTVSLFVLSGVTVLPMGAVLAKDEFHYQGFVSRGLAVVAVAAIALWGGAMLAATLRGRSAVSKAIDKLRVPLLDKIADQKKKLFESHSGEDDLRRLEIQEKAALRLKTGLFSELGGWKDFHSVAAAVIAVYEIFAGNAAP